MARSAGSVRQVVYGVYSLLAVGAEGRLGACFKALRDDPDFEYVLIDGTIVRVHQHGTGAKGGLKIRL
jgi:hypothetical protein